VRHLAIIATVERHSAADVFPLLREMERYPKYSGIVLSLTVAGSADGSSVSTWTVQFGQGVATWSQRDDFDAPNNTIRFTRLSGDIENFTGSWVLSDNEAGCTIQFTADFDIGVPGLSEIIEPMVETMLRENITAILTGLFGDQVTIEG
jgi:ribosome-associated toxin RatA of RatAB toxin-antitoxin module